MGTRSLLAASVPTRYHCSVHGDMPTRVRTDRGWGAAGLPLLLTIGIMIALGLHISLVWDDLPPSMASNFGAGGRPNAFMSKGFFFMFMVVVGGGSVAAVFAAPMLLRRWPSRLTNIPNRDYWLANDERLEAAIDRMSGMLGWMGMATALIIAVAVELTVQSNLHQRKFANDTFLVSLGAYFVVVFAALFWMMRAFKVPKEEA